MGKSTLLAQAIDENRLRPRGQDVWIGVERYDDRGDGLARAVAWALAAAAAGAATNGNGSGAPPGGDGAGDRDGPGDGAGLAVPGPAEPQAIDARSVAESIWHRAPA